MPTRGTRVPAWRWTGLATMSDGDDSSPRAAMHDGTPAAARVRSPRSAAVSAFGLLALVLAGAWMYLRSTVINIDDARFVAEMTNASSPCDCLVDGLKVREGARVAKGQALVSLDSGDARLARSEAEEQVMATRANIGLLERQAAQLRLANSGDEAEFSASAATADSLEATARESMQVAATKLDRATKLRQARMLSDADVDRVRSEWLDARRNFQVASGQKQAAAIARGRLGENRLALSIKEAEIAVQRRELAAQQAHEARLALFEQRLVVRAPFDAVVDRVFARQGDRTSPGRRLLLIHDPASVYVEANVKETDLRYVRVGMPVEIRVDAFPGRVLTGEVEGIGAATTAQFSLLPAVTPPGSFVKLTQKLPVRISVDARQIEARPGMQVELRLRRESSG